MKKYLLSFLVLCAGFCGGQNLVPNGDFEQYSTCQNGLGQLYRALYWFNPIYPNGASSPDYFNACSIDTVNSVPVNAGGYEFARSGFAYCAICTGAKGGHAFGIAGNFREYLEVELTDTLIAGTDYCFQFYLSACDSFNYISSNIGMYFSRVACKCLNFLPSVCCRF